MPSRRLVALVAIVGAALVLPASAAPKKGPRSNAVGAARCPAAGGGCVMGAPTTQSAPTVVRALP